MLEGKGPDGMPGPIDALEDLPDPDRDGELLPDGEFVPAVAFDLGSSEDTAICFSQNGIVIWAVPESDLDEWRRRNKVTHKAVKELLELLSNARTHTGE